MNKAGIRTPNVKISLSAKTKKIITRVTMIIIFCVFIFVFIIRGFFFRAEYTIEKIKFSQGTIDYYEDIELFNALTTQVKNQNYFMLNRFKKHDILHSIQATHPFVTDINFQLETGNTLGINVLYKEPALKIKYREKEYGVRNDTTIFELQSGGALGLAAPVIDTPQYASGAVSLESFFFQFSFKNFTLLLPKVYEAIPNIRRFVYLVGSRRVALFTTDEKVIYLNLQDIKTLETQFEKYHKLQKYYPDFDRIASIDLGSLDENRVIIRKW
ncbi:MAG: hypothetical protein PHT72_02560 [Candidatus Absconditabacteria bacterium]|nr:hypothetical protein [Candidatus Absconditabacteria bacterium]